MDWNLLFAGIGAAAGLGGAIIGGIAYRRSRSIKALDLRIEAQLARNDAHVALARLIELQEEAIESRKRVASAMGQYHSGAMFEWQERWDQDKAHIECLSSQVPGTDVNYDGLSPKELEGKLVGLHRAKAWIDDLTDKYIVDLRWDENQRSRLREDHSARALGRRSSFHKK